MRRFKFACAASIAVLALVAPGVASAQQYPVEGATLVLSSSTVAAGGSTVISGEGCLPSTDVSVGLGDDQLGTTTADGAGAFSATVTIPEDTAPGDYELVALCTSAAGDTTLRFAAAFTVLAEGATAPGGDDPTAPGLTPSAPGAQLPRTGPESALPVAQVAVAMLAVGSVLTVLVWRRRQTADVATTSVDA